MTVFLTEVACSAESTYIKDASTEGASTEGASIGAVCTKDAYIGDAFTYTSNVYIGAWDIDIRDDFIGDTRVGYAGGVGDVKRLKIHLRSTQILELR